MNIIVDRPQLVRVVKLYLTTLFGDLRPRTTKHYPTSVFYVNSDNDVHMQYGEKTGIMWLGYDSIWSKLESLFYLQYEDIRSIIENWIEEHYKLEVTKASPIVSFSLRRLYDF